jgi:hypothetical protein
VQFHFLRDFTRDGVVELVHCGFQDWVTDLFTKPLKLKAFLKLRDQLGVCMMLGVN